jgi:hypothetical protein
MTNSTPPSSADAAGGAGGQRLSERRESEPICVADELHWLRLVCQITDYEVGDAPRADWIALDHGKRGGPMHEACAPSPRTRLP